MTTNRIGSLSVAVLLALVCFDSEVLAQPMTGSVNQDGWSFNWSAASTSGLRITSVYRNGVKYLSTGSLPAMRVQYDNNFCGPFLDRIKWDNMQTDGSGNKVRVTVNANYIRVWVHAILDQYVIDQSWWFTRASGASGQVYPEIAASGLQCKKNHRHHPYWRLDFDVSTASSNRSQTYNNGVYTQRYTEFNATKGSVGSDVIAYPASDLSIYANLHSLSQDGTADSFSNWDFAGRKYPASANDPYNAGNQNYTPDPGDLEAAGNPSSTNNGESMDNTDLEYWYSSHLFHDWTQPTTTVNYTGPIIYMTDLP